MAHRTPGQLALQRRIESPIRVAAPALDSVLFAGEQVSCAVGRNQLDPEPPRRIGDLAARAGLAGSRDRAV